MSEQCDFDGDINHKLIDKLNHNIRLAKELNVDFVKQRKLVESQKRARLTQSKLVGTSESFNIEARQEVEQTDVVEDDDFSEFEELYADASRRFERNKEILEATKIENGSEE